MNAENKPLVSICMPAYNVEKFVGEAIRSVLDQTYRNLEVVVVDDGSTDRTVSVVESFADARLHYVRNTKNLGGYQTMNKAVSLARGDLVAVYHTDDIYGPAIVGKQVAYLQAHSTAGAVFALDHFMDETGHVYGGMCLPSEFAGKELLTYAEVFPFLLRNKNILFCCPTFMARREVFTSVGLFDAERYDIAADLDLWIRIVRQYPVGILNQRLVRYRHMGGQWSSRYKYLRTEQELCFTILDYYLAEDGWREKLSREDLIEYAFHRCDDATFRAANWVILGEPIRARELLRGHYPWRTLLIHLRRRKLRVLLLRAILKFGLVTGIWRWLRSILIRSEYSAKWRSKSILIGPFAEQRTAMNRFKQAALEK